MDLLSNIALGFEVAFSTSSLMWCAIGVLLGMAIGVLPGIGPLAAIGILLPFTFYIPPTEAIIMLAGIYYGSMYGGSTTAILLNLPGTAGAVVACFDGHPMAKQGRGGIALFMTTIASFIGSLAGLLLLAGFSPILANIALNFASPEYFALMVLGLVMAALAGEGSALRSAAMIIAGLLLGIVGTDVNTGLSRLTFGMNELASGISLVAVTTGLFGVAEVVSNAGRINAKVSDVNVSWKAMLPTRQDWKRSWMPMLRGTGIGALLGALPGGGSASATFISYGLEKRVSKHPEEFGRGAIEGVAAPEAANNAASQTAFVPTLSLGIPGDAVLAVILGALIMHGIPPGPRLIVDHPDLFWGLAVSFLIGNLLLLVLNIPLIGIWVRMLKIPYRYLYPAILVFVAMGVYSLQNSVFDIFIVLVFGIVGIVLKFLNFSPALMLLGLVLGPLLEENLRRSMVVSRGDPLIFLERPISAACIGVAVALIVFLWAPKVLKYFRARAA